MAEIHITDDSRRLACLDAGEPDEVVSLEHPQGQARVRDLPDGHKLTILVSDCNRRTVRMLRWPGVRAARSVRLVVLRGLARTVHLDRLLEHLIAGGLFPRATGIVTVGGLSGIDARLVRGQRAPLRETAALVRLAAHTTGWTATPTIALGLRVAVHGPAAAPWSAGLAHTAAVGQDWADDARELRRASADAVVVDAAAELDAPTAASIAAARTAGARVCWVVGEDAPPVPAHCPGDPVWAASTAPVDATRDNPVGCDRRQPVEKVALSDARPPAVQAAAILRQAARGVPLVAERLRAPVADLLGPRVSELLTSSDAAGLDDETARERHSVRLRRAVLTEHSVVHRWRALADDLALPVLRAPSVTALLATRHPSFLEHASAQLRAQRYHDLEVVAVLHGDDFAPGQAEAFAAGLDIPVTVVPVDARTSFGAALEAGTAAASGTVVAKIDDDDWYGPDHVADLVLALEYSQATLVGKGGEFYYLGDRDLTLRRVNDRVEEPGLLVAGNTLTMRRDDLLAVGGWQSANQGVDRRLVHDVRRAGGLVYRTHGFGHVIQRHDRGHTWQADASELLHGSMLQRRGLDLDIADAR